MNDWRPGSGAAVATRRAELLERVRSYFAKQNVLAVDTPSLSHSAATDPNIESVSVDAVPTRKYLHTSPEFFMKRLLAAGYPDIYSICRVYRGGESGMHHLPEFTMIEWYRRGYELSDIIDDTTTFIAAVLQRPELSAETILWDYRELFLDCLNIDPFAATIDDLARAAKADPDLRVLLGERRDAWLDLLMAARVASQLDESGLTVVQHFPATQAALARICPQNELMADRFEVFLGKLELANGYVELTDPVEQARRMQSDREVRKELGLPEMPVDENLLSALESGLPDCAGVALGFERLHMLDAQTDDIRDVVTFA